MPRQEKIVEVWQCRTCGFRYTAPIPASGMYCPTDHLRKTQKMVLVWSKKDHGGEPPN
jgi:ribosomal protein L37AE/L43A